MFHPVITRFLLIFAMLIGCWYLPSGQVPASWLAWLSTGEAAIKVEPTPQLPQVIVKENFIQQAEKCIADEMAQIGGNNRYTVEAVRVPAGLRLPWGSITYSCTLPNGIRKSLLTAVNVDVLVNGVPYAHMVCSMRVHVYEKVVVAATPIQREVPLRLENLRIAEREDKGNAYERYTDPKELVGKVITSNATAGTVIHSGMVKEQILVQPFTQINICTNVNGVEIKTPGTALERGRRGDYIMVQNTSSKRKVRAKVIDETNVQVVP